LAKVIVIVAGFSTEKTQETVRRHWGVPPGGDGDTVGGCSHI
jgi:hypothetical protein